MRVLYKPSREKTRSARRTAYLSLWPAERQMEAHAEAAMGRAEKLNEMVEDFAEIRRTLPFFDDTEE